MKEFFLKENSLEQIVFPPMVKKVAVLYCTGAARPQKPENHCPESLCAPQPCNLAGSRTSLVFVVQLTCFPRIRKVSCVGGRQNKHSSAVFCDLCFVSVPHSCSTSPLEGAELADRCSCLSAAYLCP